MAEGSGQSSFLSKIGSLGTLIEGFGGLTRINAGMQMQIAGASLAAGSFRNAGAASIAAANYNAQLEQIQLTRQLDAASRQLQKILGEQTVQMAASGFQAGSKSYLAVMNETLDMVDSQVRDMRTGSAQRKAAIIYEGKVAQVNYENQARQAEYQGEMAAYQARQARTDAIGGLVNQGLSFLGSFGDD